MLLEILKAHNLTTHKLVLEVRATLRNTSATIRTPTKRYPLNDTSRLRRLGPLADRPGPHLIRTTCKVPDEVKARISRSSYLSERRGRADFGFFFLLFLWI